MALPFLFSAYRGQLAMAAVIGLRVLGLFLPVNQIALLEVDRIFLFQHSSGKGSSAPVLARYADHKMMAAYEAGYLGFRLHRPHMIIVNSSG